MAKGFSTKGAKGFSSSISAVNSKNSHADAVNWSKQVVNKQAQQVSGGDAGKSRAPAPKGWVSATNGATGGVVKRQTSMPGWKQSKQSHQ